METIFAISSGRPPAAIAVMRISGPAAIAAATRLAGTLPPPRHAAVRVLRNGEDILDRALVLVFPAPNTATGEDLVELHLHGGRAVVAAVECALAAMPGCRPATAGVFTRRALGNGRIDLVQAQGLADLLEAETEQQRRQALMHAEGAISRQIAAWMADLSALRALVEATIDFDDEGDVSAMDTAVVDERTAAIANELSAALDRPSIERYRDGIRVVLVGPPNAGKSSLFNALIGRDAAIVSPIAGTTRDRIEAAVVRRGAAYTLVDTAGLRDATDDPIEQIGIARTRLARDTADIILDLSDDAVTGPHTIAVHARSDIRSDRARDGTIATACDDLSSIDVLWEAIEQRQRTIIDAGDEAAFHDQQRQMIGTAHLALATALGTDDLLIKAEELRAASQALAALLGVDSTEAMLDALFSRFCVGK
ncbi:tRNA uridine-5-carboxymethylaminomethyl(34) synthesis GTPase MnmE [Sphingomonas sp. TZW2008]|uniref:tRNA uridine-5-carboxymethylaminomethyl(34) synthesis GTPase MnmE n=1 Tax=Sphingomonas sp. TZW2008 TaxID=1917973 RepID=UPI000A26820D|nr:tRNA uridine-5-carboxymethylaminomethyl(34) synthesis GTPase MnmE [Sphingomonas sp. TZW2008]